MPIVRRKDGKTGHYMERSILNRAQLPQRKLSEVSERDGWVGSEKIPGKMTAFFSARGNPTITRTQRQPFTGVFHFLYWFSWELNVFSIVLQKSLLWPGSLRWDFLSAMKAFGCLLPMLLLAHEVLYNPRQNMLLKPPSTEACRPLIWWWKSYNKSKAWKSKLSIRDAKQLCLRTAMKKEWSTSGRKASSCDMCLSSTSESLEVCTCGLLLGLFKIRTFVYQLNLLSHIFFPHAFLSRRLNSHRAFFTFSTQLSCALL